MLDSKRLPMLAIKMLANSKCLIWLLSKIFCQASLILFNEGKSGASFFCQVAALVSATFCNFYLVKNHKIKVKNSAHRTFRFSPISFHAPH
jgi:hypothetical protein